MKKHLHAKKLALSTLTLKKLTVDQIADVNGGVFHAQRPLPVTSFRPDCGCA
jgi:hypothetical protein